MMMKKVEDRHRPFSLIPVLLFLIFSSATLTADTLPVGHLRLEALLNTEFLVNGPDEGWGVKDSGLNKTFTSPAEEGTRRVWKGSHGETGNMELQFRPLESLEGCLGFTMVGNYADTFYLPINDAHRLSEENRYIRWARGELRYRGEWFSGRLFRGVGHPSWEEEGDVFHLLPAQWQPDAYLRVSGRAVPQGGEFSMYGTWGKLTTLFSIGDETELLWGRGPTYLLRYNFLIGPFDSALLVKDEELIWSRGEHITSYSLSSRFTFAEKFPMELGILYQPFRIGETYTYVEEVSGGEGYMGSKYFKREDTVASKDALGFKARIFTRHIPRISEASLSYTYQGIVAGNLNQIQGKVKKRFTRELSGSLSLLFRKPVIGPLPYLYSGTEENPGPIYTLPRGEESPFWVTPENRRAQIATLLFTFDPTPNTWFYKYEADVPEEWNLNPGEDAPLSFAAGLSLKRFPGRTDLQTYVDENGDTVWEPKTTHGLWATKWLPSFISAVKFNMENNIGVRLHFQAGESHATGGMAYLQPSSEPKPKSLVRFFVLGLNISGRSYSTGVTYGENGWGPEEWHRRFGESMDRLYKIYLEKRFGKYFTAGVRYIGYSDEDKEYIAPELGSFNEIVLYCRLRYSGLFSFRE